jgi:hypothetical protein
LFSLPTGTEMFHFPALPPNWLYIHQQVTRHHSRRVSPFGHPRIHARLTAPRGISQPPTSFIGSQCQGIHHAPLNTYNTKNQKSYELKNSEIAHQHTNNVCVLDARNHYPQIKHHTPPPKWSDNQTLSPVSHPRDEEIAGLLPQSPIVCLAIHHRIKPVAAQLFVVAPEPHPLQVGPICTIRCDHRTPTRCGRAADSWCSLERR